MLCASRVALAHASNAAMVVGYIAPAATANAHFA
jgi:hypothetical protein